MIYPVDLRISARPTYSYATSDANAVTIDKGSFTLYRSRPRTHK